MEIEEARKKLAEMQKSINALIDGFEKETELIVEHLEVVRDDDSNLEAVDADVMLVA